MAKSKRRLGRGLGEILSDSALSDTMTSVSKIPLSQIETNPYQPRNSFDEEALSELSESIKKQGIIQPITVRKLSDNSFQLIAGERRLRASKLAGLKEIPAFVRTANDEQMMEMALIENIQREDLNPIEIALSYKRLIDEFKLKQDQLGERVGKNRATVSNFLRLLKLAPEVQAGLRDKKITTGHAKPLIKVDDPVLQLDVYHRIIEEQLSVRQTEALIREMGQKKDTEETKGKEAPLSDPNQIHLKKVADQLESKFGNKVQLNQKPKGNGEIRIQFSSNEDLNRMLELLGL